MDEKLWRLRKRMSPNGSDQVEETFYTEGGFILGLQVAYGNGSGDLMAVLPDGRILTEAAIRERYPPE